VWVHFQFSGFPDKSVYVSGFNTQKFFVLYFINMVTIDTVFAAAYFVGLCQS